MIAREDIQAKLGSLNPLSVFAVKCAVTLAVFALIAYFVDIEQTFIKIFRLNASHALVVLGLLSLQAILLALRWHYILAILGERHPILRITRIFLLGSFASFTLLNAIGGISLRVLLLNRAGTSVEKSILSLALATLFTFVALLACTVIGAGVIFARNGTEFLLDYRFALLTGVCIAAFLLVAWMVRCGTWSGIAGRFAVFISQSVASPGKIISGMLLTLVILVLGFCATATIAVGIGVEVSLVMFFAVQPAIMIMAMVPLSLGGWGLREASMIVGLGQLGVASPDALAISVLFGLMVFLATCLCGVVVFLLNPTNGDEDDSTSQSN